MTEEEFLSRWYQERPSVEAWGKFVAQKLMEQIAPLVTPVSADIFVRIPAEPRLKGDGSILTKAFYRGKKYADPLNEITDKVGVRFVVLLDRDIAIVCRALEECGEWEASKDRDYEEERAQAPYAFTYQSVHYVVRAKGEKKLGELIVAPGTPCEVQVRTLLQHAHSELTHDTIYKPSVAQTPEMHRAAAKSMALIEATGDYFRELMELIERNVAPARELSKQMSDMYRELLGREPDPTRAEGLLNDAFATFAGDKPGEAIRSLFEQKPFLLDRIRERSATKLLFRQPSIMLVYWAVSKRPADAQDAWPLTFAELKPVYTDLGLAAPTS
ncbi:MULTISPECIES: GTP pyrophosphokinase [Bradyrhizobium]|uniref:GTP pyrophosphokinase n=1 Tax=Bradyrhizobium TaxID=374 RepID=UPI00155ECED8|nr:MULTISPECIES: RelA/SpoT domain-containing protein [Bradyrhizobium]MDD1518279.1 RelA/SpoT family protein [Bradyrhizobium sp. WBAH30]MDD1540375.1 RelA/SpoT family protein [Bradyrhizobium sp. WBAH41]MDD1556180.1 RelA/SpoT family protein [Bradyrhizobium sp. WBAH23]MDD1563009.1 RelA/SpoT family protein [Bradyrhizobium sp. WBAH33]MDD1588488.1 RelA/SpoT family protein [Bradyrhizobium sp. WBAH42]